MKKITLGFITALALAVSITPFAARAKEIKTINASEEGGKVSVSGTAEAGTLAVAVMVYDESGKELIAFETAAVSDENIYYAEISVAEGKYLVKVADYDGGDFKTATVSPAEQENVPTIPGAPNSGAVK
ncbi:hypothetical protein IKF27_01955 [Candidatus Saccharibacteria bacterium]|nr:hypothetical protein [Candidatus Saccharibacteria bacterium]